MIIPKFHHSGGRVTEAAGKYTLSLYQNLHCRSLGLFQIWATANGCAMNTGAQGHL